MPQDALSHTAHETGSSRDPPADARGSRAPPRPLSSGRENNGVSLTHFPAAIPLPPQHFLTVFDGRPTFSPRTSNSVVLARSSTDDLGPPGPAGCAPSGRLQRDWIPGLGIPPSEDPTL
jgi:hypothetical protein